MVMNRKMVPVYKNGSDFSRWYDFKNGFVFENDSFLKIVPFFEKWEPFLKSEKGNGKRK